MPMAIEPEAEITISDWSSQTNWTVAAGSLQGCIAFESSLSPGDDGGDEVKATSVDSTPKSPLILYPSSPDAGPCEIKINFEQKHEIMQVYVRSTARVYEIYSEPNLQSSNEYLSTVRCGIASRDGEVLRALNVEEIVSSHVKAFNKKLAEENIKNEDDWVDVKVPDSPVLDGGNNGLQTKSFINSAKSSQDLFEATAEITDANPCISVTLRLLSLQNNGCIYVDEIYVFGNPVAPADSERQESRAEKSGSSLMAMFLPTLTQLSKTTGLSRINDKHPSVRKENQYFPEVDLGKTHPSDTVIKTQLEEKASKTDHQEVEQQEVNKDSAGPSQTDIPLQDASMGCKHNDITSQAAKMESNCIHTPSQGAKMESNLSGTPLQAATKESNRGDSLNGNVERALEQLVSGMDKIEGICLGFQEKMLMPISSIEARLRQVEQQLEKLTMKLQNSGLPSCSRVYPPDNSCIQSDANSCDNCHGYNVTGGIKSDKKGSHIEVLSVSPDDMSDSANTAQLLPALVVTAPEFPDGEEDEQENNASTLEMNSSKDKQRKNLSIDDAVVSALAGLLSAVSLETPRHTKSLTVRAPEFINEDDHENNDASPRTLSQTEKDDLVHLNDSESLQESTSHNICMERGEKVNRDPNDKQSDETGKEAEHSGQRTREDDQVEVGVEASILAEHNPRTGFDHIPDYHKNKNISCQTSEGLPALSDITKWHQIDVDSDTACIGKLKGVSLRCSADSPR